MRRERVAHRAPGAGKWSAGRSPPPARGARSPGTRAETPWVRAGTVLVLLGALAVSAAPQISAHKSSATGASICLRSRRRRARGDAGASGPAGLAALSGAHPATWTSTATENTTSSRSRSAHKGGYGAQIRYRLRYETGSTEARLGDWYWSVITGPGGERLFESFNP